MERGTMPDGRGQPDPNGSKSPTSKEGERLKKELKAVLTTEILNTSLSNRTKKWIIRYVSGEYMSNIDSKYRLVIINDVFRLFANCPKEDIMKLRGMGEKTFSEIDDYLYLIGLKDRCVYHPPIWFPYETDGDEY